jgi:hypothetical protein
VYVTSTALKSLTGRGMREVTQVFKIGGPPSICQNAGTMSSQLNWASATIFVRTKTETIDDRNTSEGVETKLRTLF